MIKPHDVEFVRNIKWESIEKDNMEYRSCPITCFQLESLRRILDTVEEYGHRMEIE